MPSSLVQTTEPVQTNRSWWDWLKPELPSNVEGVDYKIVNGSRVDLDPFTGEPVKTIAERMGISVKEWYRRQQERIEREQNIPMEERQRRADEVLRRQQEIQNQSSSPIVNFIKGLFGK
jgi:antitoxin component of RelBE/YafQ-DinJ toxin-antitoxin module